jgi:hypothetical protein
MCDRVEVTGLDGVVYLVAGTVDRPVAIVAVSEERELRQLIEGLLAAHCAEFCAGRSKS